MTACHCSHTGVERTTTTSQHRKLSREMKCNSPATPPGIRTRNFSIKSPALYKLNYPDPFSFLNYCTCPSLPPPLCPSVCLSLSLSVLSLTLCRSLSLSVYRSSDSPTGLLRLQRFTRRTRCLCSFYSLGFTSTATSYG